MPATDMRLIRRLNYLYRLCRAGERGFEVVAENVSNRGLKVVLKSYASQRAGFAEELAGEIQRLGGQLSERPSLRGIIHRGRIDIFAGLTIGAQNVENVVLSEALKGEDIVVKAYRNAQEWEAPAETRTWIERQLQEIQAAREQVALLRGRAGERLVVRLFDSEQDAQTATDALQQAGFANDKIEVVDIGQVSSLYQGDGRAVSEAVISGAFGGAIWGSIIGAVAGIFAFIVPAMGELMGNTATQTWAYISLAGLVIGTLFGAILGFLIGQGVSEEDTYLYDDSIRYGVSLLRLYTSEQRAAEAAHILHQVNAAARVRSQEWQQRHAEPA